MVWRRRVSLSLSLLHEMGLLVMPANLVGQECFSLYARQAAEVVLLGVSSSAEVELDIVTLRP